MYVLTFDSDWVPQFILDFTLDKLRQSGFDATLFLTSKYCLPDCDNIEISLHPNFLPGSTQGTTEREILSNLKNIYPDAVGLRAHKCYWHNGLLPLLSSSGILYDSSLAMPFYPGVQPFYLDGLLRLPIWWGDNVHIMGGFPFDTIDLPNFNIHGLKVFNFHPIHIYLNTKDLHIYRQAMHRVGSLPEATKESLDSWRNPGKGIGTFFDLLLNFFTQKGIKPVACREVDVTDFNNR